MIPLRQYALHTTEGQPQQLAFWDDLEARLTPEQKALYAEGGELREKKWKAGTSNERPADDVKTEIDQWQAKIKALKLSQPDSSTCQAACIAMAVRDPDIRDIRRRLVQIGAAGDPTVMARVIKQYEGVAYSYAGNASLNEVYQWLQAGELLITHGWFTPSGHVIVLDGLMRDSRADRYLVNVADPWSEFSASSWKYTSSGVKFFDGFYSEACIYAACVAGHSASDARNIYRSGKVDRSLKGMWVHRITARG